MKLVYICSPLHGNIEENIKKANEYCAAAARMNVVPLAPHTSSQNTWMMTSRSSGNAVLLWDWNFLREAMKYGFSEASSLLV